MLKRRAPIAADGVDFRQRMVARCAPGCVPDRLEESFVGLVQLAEVAQRHTEIVESLAVIGIGIARPQPLQRLAETGLGQIEFGAAQVVETHGVVATAVQGIALQRLQPIGLRLTRRVAILDKMLAGQEKLFDALDIGGRRRLGRRFGRRSAVSRCDGLKCEERLAGAVQNRKAKIAPECSRRDGGPFQQRRGGIRIPAPFGQAMPCAVQADHRVAIGAQNMNADDRGFAVKSEARRGLGGRRADRTDLADRIPVLAPSSWSRPARERRSPAGCRCRRRPSARCRDGIACSSGSVRLRSQA